MVASLLWTDVEEGAPLPPLDFPISLKTLMLEAAGTRDFMPYHHNSAYAKATGSRDAFVNSMFLQGLFARFVSDWSGPASQPVSATLLMVDQLCLGDVARVNGTVIRKWTDGVDSLVEIALTVTNHLGRTANSTTVIAMPTEARTEARPRTLAPASYDDSSLDERTPAEAREQLGRMTVIEGVYPVSESQIMYLCEMVRDINPLFDDGEIARSGRFGGMVAPPSSLMVWSKDRATQIGVDRYHPDVDLPDQDPWPAPAETPSGGYRMPGVSEVIAQGITLRFGAPIRPGDRLSMASCMWSCSPLKRTKLGLGYFVTFRDVYTNQHGEVVGDVAKTILQYGVPEDVAKEVS
jgi:acyl dehydratase